MQGGEKFKNKYRVDSSRLIGYDYSQDGMYFITICTEGKNDYFGEIRNEKIVLNEMGAMADKFWQEIPTHFPFAEIDVYQIMPNHLHGIIVIDWELSGGKNTLKPKNITTTYNGQYQKFSDISPKFGSLSTIIRSYKSVVTKNSKLITNGFVWQSRFHDHIIRNEHELFRIREYIVNNPAKWESDQNN